jgi:NADH-quinone oxidoreductase subunit F
MGIMPGTTICGLADGAGWPIKNAIAKFRRSCEVYAGKKSRVPAGMVTD